MHVGGKKLGKGEKIASAGTDSGSIDAGCRRKQ
jgi:hypothetical protein